MKKIFFKEPLKKGLFLFEYFEMRAILQFKGTYHILAHAVSYKGSRE